MGEIWRLFIRLRVQILGIAGIGNKKASTIKSHHELSLINLGSGKKYRFQINRHS